MKKLLTLIFCIIIITVTFSLVTAYTGDELSNIKIYSSSNGDGFTPFDLRWNDEEFGIISFNRQKADGSIPFTVYVFLDGEMCYGSATYYDGDARVKIDITNTLRDSGNGEYIFIVYASDTNGNIRGEKSKSEPFIYSDAPERTPAPPTPERNITPMEPLTIEQIDQFMSLTVEIHSEKQAVIVLTDNRLPDILQKIEENYDYFVNWDIVFGTNPEYFIRTSTSVKSSGGESWRDIVFDLQKGSYTNPEERNNAEHIHWQTPSLKILRPSSPYWPFTPQQLGHEITMAYTSAFNVKDNNLIWEISFPPNENIDFTTIIEYSIYNQMYIDSNSTDVNFTRTLAASDVVDMRNFGQEYDIGVPDSEIWSPKDLREKVIGITYEQADFLYFTPPENRYVIWRGEFNQTINPSELWLNSPNEMIDIYAEVFEIVYFDENRKVTNITTKVIHGEDEDDYMFSIILLARGSWSSKHKLVMIDGEYISYTRSGTTVYDSFDSILSGNDAWDNISDIDDYIEAMKSGVLYYDLLEIIEWRD